VRLRTRVDKTEAVAQRFAADRDFARKITPFSLLLIRNHD